MVGVDVGIASDRSGCVLGVEKDTECARASVNERDRGVVVALSTFGDLVFVILAARKRTGSPSGVSAIDSTWLRLLEDWLTL